MATAYKTWREALGDRIPAKMAGEIDEFENQMALKKQGKTEDRIFAELRLRRGAYGQRYDNGFRHDGEKSQQIPFPSDLQKGPDTYWQAPGMQRIKIPGGKMTAEQLDVIADCAEEYSDAILHVTTRQDIQLHFINIEDTPDMHRRMAAAGVTTREACGNSWRNVTACPLSGICRDEAFDVTPYATETAWYFMGHRDVQDFGRKFKPAFSGCAQHACGLVNLHDIGYVAKIRDVDGQQVRGFEVWVGGGLGAIPHEAKLLREFATEAEIIPLSQAVSRVYARLGEKKNRNKARIKFLVAKLGIEEFRRLVDEEIKILEAEPGWTQWIDAARAYAEGGHPAPVSGQKIDHGPEYDKWLSTNVYRQRQDGFSAVTINLPLGDITSEQARVLADIARKYTNDSIRTTVEQNLLLRWIHTADLPALYGELKAVRLHAPGAESIVDVTSCPGTDTCKLGISSSRGLAGVLRRGLAEKQLQYDAALKDMRIKVSGCFNSCGQHHVADIGFFGSSRTVGNFRLPAFQLILGGEWTNNAGAYGMAMGAYPSKRIPDVVDRLLDIYQTERQPGEKFRETINRVGKKVVKERLTDLAEVPQYQDRPEFYRDWADSREYTIGDIGVGECAGEVVSLTEFSIAEAESQVFDAQILLEEDGSAEAIQQAHALAFQAMVSAAQGLIKMQNPDIANDPTIVVDEFRRRFYDTELFFDKYAKGKFGDFFFAAFERRNESATRENTKRGIEEARLFIEATVACNQRILSAGGTGIATALQPPASN